MSDHEAERQIVTASDFIARALKCGLVVVVCLVGLRFCHEIANSSESRPIPPIVSGVPTLAPRRTTAADETLAAHCDGWLIWDTETVDGDTWDCRCEKSFGQGWKICTDGRKRFRGDWDAWESLLNRRFDGEPASDEELAKGRKAADAFDGMMNKAVHRFVRFVGDGGFSRDKVRLFWIMASGEVVEAGPWMKKNGHDRDHR